MKTKFLVVASMLLFVTCCFFLPTYGQQASRYVPNLIPPSPEAVSLGKFVEVPVNLYQGLPQISIPIYEIKIGNVSVPIALKYHASGFRMSETASSVGAGWVLEAGGTLSRTLRGRDDEGMGGMFIASHNARWFFTPSGYPKLGNTTNPNSPSYGGTTWSQTNGGGIMCTFMENQQKGDFDTEPDLYTFSAPGLSGKFVHDLDQKIHFIPHQNIHVSSQTGAAQGKNWYKLTSAQGIEYLFGTDTGTPGYVERNESVLYSYLSDNIPSIPPAPQHIYNSAWHLSGINSKTTGEFVSFEYEAENTETISLTNQSTEMAISDGAALYNGGFLRFVETKNKTATSGGRLKKILGPEGIEITFIYETTERKDLKGGHRLKTIEIRKYGVLVKKYELYHSYFGSISSYDTCYLKLDAVEEQDPQGNKLPAYTLTYHGDPNTGYFPTPIGRNSYAQDMWGFYNAQNINRTDFIPAFKELPSAAYPDGYYYKGGANREINEAVNTCGMLTKIKYPTGGFHELIYEQNEYRLPTNQNHYEQIKLTGLASTAINDGNITVSAGVTTYRLPFTIASQTGNKWVYVETEGYNINPQGGISQDCYTAIENASGQVLFYNPIGFKSLAPGDYFLVARKTSTCGGEDPTISIEWENDGVQIYSKKTGGVRIKNVRTHDGISESNDIYKSYLYQDALGRSTGRLNYLPNFRTIATYRDGHIFTSEESGIPLCADDTQGTMIRINAFMPSVSNHLGYKEVQESFGKKTTTIVRGQPVTEIIPHALGKKVYTYTHPESDPEVLTAYPTTESQNPTHQNGMLLSETVYDKQGRKLTETINTYTYETLKDVYGVRIGVLDAKFCSCQAQLPSQTYIYSVLREHSDWSALIQSVQRNYSFTTASTTASTYQEIITDYVYDSQMVNGEKVYFLKEQKTYNSEGKELKTKYKYPFQLSISGREHIPYTSPIETIQFKDGKIVGATLTKYLTSNVGSAVPQEIYAMDLLAPLTPQPNEETGFVDYGMLPSTYKLKAIFGYDAFLRIINVKDEQEQEQSFIRVAQGSERVTANVVGAPLNKVAYMGMEPEMAGHNFGVAHGNQMQGGAFSGDYHVKAGAIVNSATMPTGRYILSFYTKGLGNVSVNIGSQSVSSTTSTNWQYQQMELNITNTSGSVVTITPGASVALDEIRLHPVGAQMTSRSYYTWGGIRDIVDVKGQKLTYEYDNFYRLKAIRDLDGNIIKTWNYHYKD